MIRTYKVMLVPNKVQRTKLFMFAGAARFAYNWALSKIMESLRKGKGFISQKVLRKEFTKLRHSQEFKWLEKISNNVTKQAIKDLYIAYDNYYEKKNKKGYEPYTKKQIEHAKRIGKTLTVYDRQGHPKFKSKKKRQKYSFYQDPCRIQFTETHVKVEGFSNSKRKNRQGLNWIRLAEHGRIPSDAKYFNPRITFDGINWWISIGVEVENTVLYKSETEELGIDLGVSTIATLSDGKKYKNINKTRLIKNLEKRKRRLQRSLSRKYRMNNKEGEFKKTKNIIKLENALLRLEHKLTNLRKAYQSEIITELIDRKPRFICIEDLNVSGMMKNKYLSKSVQQQNLREFRTTLENRSNFVGIPLVIADRWFPSSKTCNCCGAIKYDLRLKDRIYKCDFCGYEEDRDLNAALNLRDYGRVQLGIA